MGVEIYYDDGELVGGPNGEPADLYWVGIEAAWEEGVAPLEIKATDFERILFEDRICAGGPLLSQRSPESFVTNFQVAAFSPENAAERGLRAFRRSAEAAELAPWRLAPGSPSAGRA